MHKRFSTLPWHYWSECKLLQSLWNSVEVLLFIKHRTTIWSSIATSEWNENNIIEFLYFMFTAVLFTISKMWRQTKSPSAVEWRKRKISIHTKSWPLNNMGMEHWPPSHVATVESPCTTLQLAFHICSYMFQDPTKHESCGTVANAHWKIYTYQ